MAHSGHKLQPDACRLGVPAGERIPQFLGWSAETVDVVVLADDEQHRWILPSLCDLTGSLDEIEPSGDFS
jgi:hypothetical protein